MSDEDETIKLLAEQGAQFTGLRELIDEKLDRVTEAVEQLASATVTATVFNSLEKRVILLEMSAVTDDSRLRKLERISWLQAGIFAVFGVPAIAYIVVWALSNLIR
jgi:hypothetical protein